MRSLVVLIGFVVFARPDRAAACGGGEPGRQFLAVTTWGRDTVVVLYDPEDKPKTVTLAGPTGVRVVRTGRRVTHRIGENEHVGFVVPVRRGDRFTIAIDQDVPGVRWHDVARETLSDADHARFAKYREPPKLLARQHFAGIDIYEILDDGVEHIMFRGNLDLGGHSPGRVIGAITMAGEQYLLSQDRMRIHDYPIAWSKQ